MTSIFQSAINKVKTLPQHRQDEVGEMILAIAEQDQSTLALSTAQQTEIKNRLSCSLEFVPKGEMSEFFRKLTG